MAERIATMKIKVFYDNGTKEVLDHVKDLGIVGRCRISKDYKILHQVAVRFEDDDMCILHDVRRIEEV